MDKFNLKVLFVEDDHLLLKLTTRQISKYVNEIYSAADGNEGFNLYLEKQPDLVITDIDMPNLDGLTMSREILERNRETPIIILSSFSSSEVLLDAIDVGVAAFLVKPFKIENLLKLMSKIQAELRTKKELDQQFVRIRTLIDFQENLILLTDGSKVIEANKKFLEFVGYRSAAQMNERPRKFNLLIKQVKQFRISNFEDGYYSIFHNPEMNNIRINLAEKIYLFRFNKVPNEELYIVSLTDVTEIETKAIRLEYKASIDSLTKIYNRNKFAELYKFEYDKALTENQVISIIMFDIDHFKKINDTFGHNVGDEVLIRVVIEVQKKIRRTDIFARWGGEEFLLLLPGTEGENAALIAEKLRSSIEGTNFHIDRHVTISFGVTELQAGDTMDSAVSRVDEALYLAKNSGRNKVCYK